MAFGKRNTSQLGAGRMEPAVFGKLRQPMLAATSAAAGAAVPALMVVVPEPGRLKQPPAAPSAPTSAPTQDGPGFRASIDTELVAEVSSELLGVMIGAYSDARGSHLETIMGALAALAGEFCLRAGAEAAGQELPSGQQYILSSLAHPYIYSEGCTNALTIWSMICSAAVDAGASPEQLPDPQALAARAVAAIEAGQPYPPRLQIPESNFPNEWSPNACPRHRQTVRDVMAGAGMFAADEIAMALGITMMMVFVAAKESFEANALTPETLARLALEIMIAVAHMAPVEIVVD